MTPKTKVLGIPVSPVNLRVPTDLTGKDPRKAVIVTFVNPLACAIADAKSEYVPDLDLFDWVLCDGIGMVIAARSTEGLNIQRAAFDLTSLAVPVFKWFAADGVQTVLVGGKSGIAGRAGVKLMELFPGLNVEATFGGYPNDLPAARQYLLDNRNAAVICGMGAPLQERFLLDLKEAGWRGLGFTCGGFFDQLLLRVDYYPRWIDHYNLRFLYRLYEEPQRLWRRYLIDYQAFVRRFIRSFITP